MHVRIESDPPGPLAVIGELPDARLAMIEGLNGIGKTLAVRLLQLCAGTMPYRANSQAWASLLDGLGVFTVSVTGLQEVKELVWVADTRDWVTFDDSQPSTEWFREIRIDGQPASLDEVRSVMSVHRIAGDEGMIETLAQLADTEADVVRDWSARYAAVGSSPLWSLETRLGDAQELLGDVSVDRYAELVASARAATNEFNQAKKTAKEIQDLRDLSADTLNLRTRLIAVRSRTPGLTAELAEVDASIDQVRREREEVQQQFATVAGRVARAEPLKRELRNARRTLNRNRDKLSEALADASAMASQLGLSVERVEIQSAIDQLEERASVLRAEQSELDAAPAMRSLIREVTGELAEAEAKGLGDQIAVDDPETEVKLTVTQTRVGMVTRDVFLEGQPPSPQARDLTESLAEVAEDLTRSRALVSAVEEVERFQRLVQENEERVARSLAAGAGAAGDELKALEERRRAIDETLLQLAARRAGLAQRLGTTGEGTTERALAQQLARALDRAGIAESELDNEFALRDEAATRAQAELSRAEDLAAGTRRAVARIEADIRRASATLSDHEELGWLREALDTSLPSSSAVQVPELLAYVEGARSVLERIVDRLGAYRIQLAAVERALREVGRRVRGQVAEAVEYVEELQGWIGGRLSDWFNNPRVRHELLPEAKGDVVVDLSTREVLWSESRGSRSRPLEAFSSGEQAFAYTRARLAVLDEERDPATNRLIVLDEFGAFIAHDRLEGLLAYLRDRASHRPGDQVLVVLPLSSDYAQMAATSVGAEAKRLQGLVDQITRRGYAVRVLMP